MVRSSQPLVERMALIWHDWFATGDVDPQRLGIGQIELFKRRGLGSFRKLLLDVTRDPAMLVWLSGVEIDNDSDVYKLIEGMANCSRRAPTRRWKRPPTRSSSSSPRAQEPDGYLVHLGTINDPANPPPEGPERLEPTWSSGTTSRTPPASVRGGGAYHPRRASDACSTSRIRNADLVALVFGPGRNPASLRAPGDRAGHDAGLADHTGEAKYLDLARFFIDTRGTARDTATASIPMIDPDHRADRGRRPRRAGRVPVRRGDRPGDAAARPGTPGGIAAPLGTRWPRASSTSPAASARTRRTRGSASRSTCRSTAATARRVP